MQNLICYVNAANTLGEVRDACNAKAETPPIMTRAIATKIKLRLFPDGSSTTPYPLADLQAVASWAFVMDDDFDSTSNYILIADHSSILVHSVTDTIDGTSRTFSEIEIPISAMNTSELITAIGTSETITLNGELVGYDSTSKEIFALQIKSFTVRNRISSTGNPSTVSPEYLTATQVRALLNAGVDMIFAAEESDDPDDWHTTQLSTDTVLRVRLRGDTRTWTTGDAADCGWSDEIALIQGPQGNPGTNGTSYYCHAAFATDASGTGFITSATDWTTNHKFVGFLTTTKTAAQLVAADFAGLWIRFIADNQAASVSVADAGNYFDGATVEAVLQEIGSDLNGLAEALEDI